MAKEYNVPFFETSAKQDLNVETAFLTLATECKNRLLVDGNDGPAGGGHTKLGAANAAPVKAKGCC